MGNWTRADTRALIETAPDCPTINKWAVATIRRHHHEPGLIVRMARLEMFIAETDRLPFVWGARDCSLVIADWAMANGYPDSAADLRGTYATETECRDLLAARGGLIETVQHCASLLDLKPLREPEFGCIAVIGSPHNVERQWAAIWQGFSWLVFWGAGATAQWVPFKAKILAMWRI